MIICRPAEPEAKGLVERLHDYLEGSFLPGRTFTGRRLQQSDQQLAGDGEHPLAVGARLRPERPDRG